MASPSEGDITLKLLINIKDMKRSILFILTVLVSLSAAAQAKLDTLYYDKDGYKAPVKAFADYYRIVSYADGQNGANKYRTFHMNGEIMSSGEFISIDANDDRNSQFIGTVVIYDKNGNLSAVRNYQDGLLHGLSEEYFENGIFLQEEFAAGKPSKDYYVKSDREGNIVKIRYSDNSVIWESPAPSEISVSERDGVTWRSYSKNGVTLSLHTTKIKDYGKYHVMNIVITNNSLLPIVFEPSMNIQAESINFKKNEKQNLKVYSCEEYLKKYDKRTAWGSALFAVNEVMTVFDSGVSEQKSVSVNNKGEKTVTYTKSYSPFDHYLSWKVANMESKDYEMNTKEGREVRQMGYFKDSTILPGESVSGYVYVERVKGNEVTAKIDIEGAVFPFTWVYKK